ncbi:hypothetical protein Hanom_Chr04g00300381 [Helianthus anomalus]
MQNLSFLFKKSFHINESFKFNLTAINEHYITNKIKKQKARLIIKMVNQRIKSTLFNVS